MLHIYYGDGKGKTTAAMGLALRALGHEKHVTILQFLKDGSSGEIALLRRCGADVHNNAALRTALAAPFDLLVLDEACAACRTGLVDESLLQQAAALAGQGREVVFTGRNPAAWMLEQADYATEMRAEKHPYSKGVAAREGVEF